MGRMNLRLVPGTFRLLFFRRRKYTICIFGLTLFSVNFGFVGCCRKLYSICIYIKGGSFFNKYSCISRKLIVDEWMGGHRKYHR